MLAPLVGSMIWSSPPAFSNLLWASPPQQKSAATESRCKKKILGCRRETVGQSVGRPDFSRTVGRPWVKNESNKWGPSFPRSCSLRNARAPPRAGDKKNAQVFKKTVPTQARYMAPVWGGRCRYCTSQIACLHDRSLYNHVCSRSFAFVVACLHDRLLN